MVAEFFIRVLRIFAKALLSFLLVMLLYFAAALVGSVIPVNTEQPKKGNITIYLRSNGAHTDFILPLENHLIDWTEFISPDYVLAKSENFRYVSFGWGDLKFYRETPEWEDLRFPVAFQAVFLNTPSAMHVTFLETIRMDQPTISIEITPEQYLDLSRYISNSFQRNDSGEVIPVADLHFNRHDAFFHAKGSLHFFYTCNTWVNEGLKESGLRACLWTPFDEGIFYQYL